MATRDMTKRQFVAALRRHGCDLGPALSIGYVELPLADGSRVGIYRHNAGPRLRDQLAYLLKERDRCEARKALLDADRTATRKPHDWTA